MVTFFVCVVLLVLLGPTLLRGAIREALGGYERDVTTPEGSSPLNLQVPKRVAVIGSGLAGLTSAVTLAERGFAVTLFEASGHVGGKLGSWPVTLKSGETVFVSHGFHAFFPGYYNLNRFLDRRGLRRGFRSIGEYAILSGDGSAVRFTKLETTPVLNLLALARAGVFKVSEAMAAPGRDLYGVFLEYDEATTFARYDGISFERFNELARVTKGLRVAFNTFARAFFADGDRLSLAELIKSFHFYYLSHDGGLVYDYPTRDYEASLLAPLRRQLEEHHATLRLNTPVQALAKTTQGFTVNDLAFDKVIVATDVVGAKAIVGHAAGLSEAVTAPFRALEPGQRYAVLRVWLDRDVRDDVPVFVITDRVKLLDAVALYHRVEDESAEWVRTNGGAVIELHCYAVPDAVTPEFVKAQLLEEVVQFFPELAGFVVRDQHFQLHKNFTAFHLGMFAQRPTVETGVPGLYCAGDWVKLPFPAMLMEAACASGLCAANAVLREEGLREEHVTSVPLRGLMAGIPQPPARVKLLGR